MTKTKKLMLIRMAIDKSRGAVRESRKVVREKKNTERTIHYGPISERYITKLGQLLVVRKISYGKGGMPTTPQSTEGDWQMKEERGIKNLMIEEVNAALYAADPARWPTECGHSWYRKKGLGSNPTKAERFKYG